MTEQQTLLNLKKDNKIKINEDSNNYIKFLKQTMSHSHDRLAHKIKKRRLKLIVNEKARETKTGQPATSKIKRKYAKSA